MSLATERRVVVGSLVAVLASTLLAGCSGSALSAPSGFGDWTTEMAWAEDFDDPRAVTNAELGAERRKHDTASISTDFAAPAATELYVLGNHEETLFLRMVATQAPAYFVPAVDVDYQVVAGVTPSAEIQSFGNVDCLVQHPSMLNPESIENVYTECMRRTSDLTLWLGPTAMLPADLAELTDVAWAAAGGPDEPPTQFVVSDPSGESSTPFPAMDQIGDYVKKETTEGWANAADRLTGYKAIDEASLTAIHGVASFAQTYASRDWGSGFALFGVRTDTPPPFVMYEDPAHSGFIAPINEVIEMDGVRCEVRNNAVPEGGSEDDLHPEVDWCQRTGDGLTIWLADPFGDTRTSVAEAVDLVREAFEAASV